MQNDEIDILGTLTGILKTLKETNKLASKPLDQWPTYAATIRKITDTEDDGKVYQCQELKCFSAAVSLYSAKYGDYASRVASASSLGCRGRIWSLCETSSSCLAHMAGRKH